MENNTKGGEQSVNRLKKLREGRYTQEQIAALLGVSRSTYTKYEKGDIQLGRDILVRLSRLYDCSIDYILGEDDASPGAIRVPIYGTIPAGIPAEAIEDIIDYEEVPEGWARGGKEYFGLKVKGDSMAPKYSDGDVVIFRKQDTCESGQDCAVMVNSDEATFKRVKLESWGVALIPINPAYETMIYDNSLVKRLPVRVLGVAVQIRRDV